MIKRANIKFGEKADTPKPKYAWADGWVQVRLSIERGSKPNERDLLHWLAIGSEYEPEDYELADLRVFKTLVRFYYRLRPEANAT